MKKIVKAGSFGRRFKADFAIAVNSKANSSKACRSKANRSKDSKGNDGTMRPYDLMSDWPGERWRDRRILLGVSGGADSVALLLAMHELADTQQLVVAHLNHGWRGAESDQDAAFVSELCAHLNRPCITQLLQDRDESIADQTDLNDCRQTAMLAKAIGSALENENVTIGKGESAKIAAQTFKTEEVARSRRYEFFKQSAYQVGASYIVTAHTADDRAETLMHNLLRGSGLAGAASLVMFRTFDQDLVLARPLLSKRRVEIEAFLAERKQAYREDSSNRDSSYRRNFLRHQVLPLIAQQYPAATNSLVNFSELAEELLEDLDNLAKDWLEQIDRKNAESRNFLALSPSPHTFVVSQAEMLAWPWSIVQCALRQVWNERGWPLGDMTRGHWQAIKELREAAAAVVNLPGGLRAEASSGFLAIGR